MKMAVGSEVVVGFDIVTGSITRLSNFKMFVFLQKHPTRFVIQWLATADATALLMLYFSLKNSLLIRYALLTTRHSLN